MHYQKRFIPNMGRRGQNGSTSNSWKIVWNFLNTMINSAVLRKDGEFSLNIRVETLWGRQSIYKDYAEKQHFKYHSTQQKSEHWGNTTHMMLEKLKYAEKFSALFWEEVITVNSNSHVNIIEIRPKSMEEYGQWGHQNAGRKKYGTSEM